MTATIPQPQPQHLQSEEQTIVAFSDAHVAEIEAADWVGIDISAAQLDELRTALNEVRDNAQALQASEAITTHLAGMESALCQADNE